LVNVWAILGPEPALAPLTLGWETTVQVKEVPGVKLLNAMEVAAPEQMDWEDGVATAKGTGLTVTVTDAQAVVLQEPCALT
jgi:hypothetical protein